MNAEVPQECRSVTKDVLTPAHRRPVSWAAAQAGLLEEAQAARRRAEADADDARKALAAEQARLRAATDELAEERRERAAARAAAAAAAAQAAEHRSAAQARPKALPQACSRVDRVVLYRESAVQGATVLCIRS